MSYIKLVNGEAVEITEHQMRCEKLGLPEETPEAEVTAAWNAFQQALTDEQSAEELQQAILTGAAQRLAAFDPAILPALLVNIEDVDTREAIRAIHDLIVDIRTIVMAVLR